MSTAGAKRQGWLAALVVVLAALTLLPAVPSAAALAGGILLAVTLGNPLAERTRWLSRKMLPAAIVGLGAAMDLPAVLRVGVRGAGVAFDGLHYVQSVTHQITRGEYKQRFKLVRNGLISTLPSVPA